MTYYRLSLTVTPATQSIAGSVLIRGITAQDLPPYLTLDLMNTLSVDSVHAGGVTSSFTQQTSAVTIHLTPQFHIGDQIELEVFYHGSPVPTQFGSFVITTHSGSPWIWSLSEPYGARDWWPCKDTPADKADSADIFITVDSALSVGSNGVLASVTPAASGMSTWHWRERYPIATYLVSVAISNYVRYSDWYVFGPHDSLEILNYVLPESLAAAQQALPHAIDGLRIFSSIFCPYPFLREKYGHAQFGGNAMEHQTMTSLPAFDEGTIIHELAHQWFGDMITCRSWKDLWLNEGFATYSTALYYERTQGDTGYIQFMQFHLQRARTAVGPVVSSDTSDVRTLFNGARVYSKGAVVLHMLRHVLGDTLFFRSLSAYAQDSSLRYGTATTDDFRAACERTSGTSLGYFFDEWLLGENYPIYTFSRRTIDSAGLVVVRVTVNQSTGTTHPSFFRMPIDIRFDAPGWDSTVTVWNVQTPQVYEFILPYAPSVVQLDPDQWILRDVQETSHSMIPSAYTLRQNFPNPVNAGTRISYDLPRRTTIDIAVYDITGGRCATLFHGTQIAGTYTVDWSAAGLPSGAYFCRMTGEGVEETLRMLLIR